LSREYLSPGVRYAVLRREHTAPGIRKGLLRREYLSVGGREVIIETGIFLSGYPVGVVETGTSRAGRPESLVDIISRHFPLKRGVVASFGKRIPFSAQKEMWMRTPSLNLAPETLLKSFGIYHLTRLKADKNLKDLADAFETAQKRMKDKMEAFDAAFIACQTAMAVRDGEDAAFDMTMGGFANAILTITGSSRKAPLYLKYFPDGIGAVTDTPLEEELMKAGVILSKLAEEEDESLKAHTGAIRAAMDNLGKAMDLHRASIEMENQAAGLLKVEKVNWLDAYKRSYRDLTRLFYKAPKKAEGYFKPASKGDKADKEAKKEPETPATPKV